MKKEVRLYNLIFPIFMLYVIPTPYMLLFILPANFLIDSLVLYLAARARKLDAKAIWKKCIARVWGLGFLCDLIGGALILVLGELVFSELNPYVWPDIVWFALPGVILAGVLIYFLNKRISFQKTELEPEQVHHLSLMLAIFTAPYSMMLPFYVG